MTHLHDDPARFAEDAIDGFCRLHASAVRRVPGGAVRREAPPHPKVAVLPGGGSGHYPAFYGVIGHGLADGAVSGNIFTSPSAQDAYDVATAAHSGAGVVFTYGNYAGDVMNFGLATERLRAEGVAVENVVVTDDIASAPPTARGSRRGIAGDFVVFKVMGAAAEEGASLADVARLGRACNDRTRTIGTAFAGCTFPGADRPHFDVPPGSMGLGLGIHGEPGLQDLPCPSARELASDFVDRLLAEKPDEATTGSRVAVVLNGLGTTKMEELFVMWSTIADRLDQAGLTVVMPEVGELVTSLDMAGVSLTLTWLDPELERLWCAPACTPAFRRGTAEPGLREAAGGEDLDPAHTRPDRRPTTPDDATPPAASGAARQAAALALEGLLAAQQALHTAEAELGRADAVAGDGDHGRGMVRGIDAAVEAARTAVEQDAGVSYLLEAAGDAWAARAGGTSGVLWGAGLRAAASPLDGEDLPGLTEVLSAVDAFAARIRTLGGAAVGDKTLVDALVPFRDRLATATAAGADLASAWVRAAAAAHHAAQETSRLTPRKGRARPLADRSLGTPDPGALSFALVVHALHEALAPELARTRTP